MTPSFVTYVTENCVEEPLCLYGIPCIVTLVAIFVAWRLIFLNTESQEKCAAKKKKVVTLDQKEAKSEVTKERKETLFHKDEDANKQKPIGKCSPVKSDTASGKQKGKTRKVQDDDDVEVPPNPSLVQEQVNQAVNREMWKNVENTMTDEQRRQEREAQREQLAAIFKLMESQKQRFGLDNMGEVEEQMKLYM